jgi:hypothetical protein
MDIRKSIGFGISASAFGFGVTGAAATLTTGLAAVAALLTGCGDVLDDNDARGAHPATSAHVGVAHLSPDAPTVDFAIAFAIGGKTGATTNPLRVLRCADRAPAP